MLSGLKKLPDRQGNGEQRNELIFKSFKRAGVQEIGIPLLLIPLPN
jgi:hypothetical protein